MKRRDFFRHAGAASLAASFPFLGDATIAQAKPVLVDVGLQAKREAMLKEMDAKRGETRLRMLPEDARLVHLLTLLANAQKALEIGTFHGYSSIWMAMALEQTGGELVTIEIDPERLKIAKSNLLQAGLSTRVQCLEGDAHEVAKKVEGPFDVVLIDADKDRTDDYFRTIFPKLSPGGVIILNHVVAFQDLMENYFTLVDSTPQMISSRVSTTMKDALLLSFKKR